MEEIVITVQPGETISIVIDRLELINISEDYSNWPDLLAIYNQAKELNNG